MNQSSLNSLAAHSSEKPICSEPELPSSKVPVEDTVLDLPAHSHTRRIQALPAVNHYQGTPTSHPHCQVLPHPMPTVLPGPVCDLLREWFLMAEVSNIYSRFHGKQEKQSVSCPQLSPTAQLFNWVALVSTHQVQSSLGKETQGIPQCHVRWCQPAFFPLHVQSEFV